MALEIIFLCLLVFDILSEVRQSVTRFREALIRYKLRSSTASVPAKACRYVKASFSYWTSDKWNILDTVTLILLLTQVSWWWDFVTTQVPTFSPASGRRVYKSLHSNARFLELHHGFKPEPPAATASRLNCSWKYLQRDADGPIDAFQSCVGEEVTASGATRMRRLLAQSVTNSTNGTKTPFYGDNNEKLMCQGGDCTNGYGLGWSAELDNIVYGDFAAAENMVASKSSMNMLIVIIILCQVMRLLKVLDFQPKLALVTRTVLNAGWELFHFLLLFALQTGAFSGCAYVAFGSIHQDFATFGQSIATCFGLFMGETGVHYDMVSSPMAAQWYFFYLSYMLIQVRNKKAGLCCVVGVVVSV